MVKVWLLPLTEPALVPGRLTEVTPTLSLTTAVNVTVLVCAVEYKWTILPPLLLLKLAIDGSCVSIVCIDRFTDLFVTLPAASATTTLTVSELVLFTV